ILATGQRRGDAVLPGQCRHVVWIGPLSPSNRDIDPALPVQPSPGHQAAVPARSSRRRRLARRLRIITARTRAIAWKLVKLSGEEFVKGFANRAGAVTALVLGVVAVAYALGIDPAEAVRRMLGMQLPSCPEPGRPRFRARRRYATPLWLSERFSGARPRTSAPGKTRP
ncbi:hypothetical protein, partial [Streptomyces sp. NPDC002533]